MQSDDSAPGAKYLPAGHVTSTIEVVVAGAVAVTDTVGMDKSWSVYTCWINDAISLAFWTRSAKEVPATLVPVTAVLDLLKLP